jgi:hypothetical protein
VIYTTRLSYLKWSLTMPYGEEILFVGSGGVFEYTDAAQAQQNLHRQLMLLLDNQTQAPSSRFGTSCRLVHTTKRRLKRLLGRGEQDLYDLGSWIVFGD